MSYVKTNWVNDQAPAINATNLNKIEQGIYDNDVNISGINETLGVDTNTWIGTTAYGEGDIVIYNDKIYQNISGTSTTTNPAEDTTNWDEITIFDTDSINDDLIDKTKFIKNITTNSGVNSYSCNYVNNANTYSTSEVKTDMTWIDGKPIYRKVITMQNQVAAQVSVGAISNLDSIVSLNGILVSSTLKNVMGSHNDDNNYSSRLYMYGNEIYYQQGSGWRDTSYTIQVIVEYTKSS